MRLIIRTLAKRILNFTFDIIIIITLMIKVIRSLYNIVLGYTRTEIKQIRLQIHDTLFNLIIALDLVIAK